MAFATDEEWATGLCKGWNWNANPAEIAKELIDMSVTPDANSYRWRVVKRAFLEFFPDNGERDWEIISQIVEVFGD
jgi:hypothetical protein